MEKCNISKIVGGFRNIVANIPIECENYDQILNDTWELFSKIMEEILPSKFFALHRTQNDEEWDQVEIFDTSEQCEDWISFVKSIPCACEGDTVEKITCEEFQKMAIPFWEDIDHYIQFEQSVTFKLD